MSEHTPGKLYARELDLAGWVDIVTTDPDGTMSLPFIACKHHDPEANARRLVACWNACEGITTERLEDLGRPLMAHLIGCDERAARQVQEADSLRAVNAELLEALKTARDHIDMDALEVSHCKDADQIRTAIASARKQGEQG